MELDRQFKQLVQELGHAINDSLADSERIAEVMGRIRAAGYDLFLVLEVTVGFNRRGESAAGQEAEPSHTEVGENEFRFTNQDTQFLRALRISVEEKAPDDPNRTS